MAVCTPRSIACCEFVAVDQSAADCRGGLLIADVLDGSGQKCFGRHPTLFMEHYHGKAVFTSTHLCLAACNTCLFLVADDADAEYISIQYVVPARQCPCLSHVCIRMTACVHSNACTQKNHSAEFAWNQCKWEMCLQGQLILLRLDHNRLGGSLPTSWSSSFQLRYVELDDNTFTGSVPATWSNWSQVGTSLLANAASSHMCLHHTAAT